MTILAVADTDLIASGRAALADGDWLRARDAFAGAAARGDSADALDGLGRALWWQKDVAAAMDARTRAYVSFRRQRRFSEAATTAVWLAREHRALYRNDTVADGWLARGESMCERAGDSPASGWLLVARAEATPKPAAGIDWAERAIEIARAADDADLEIVALARLGALEIMAGAVEAGLAHIDEAMAAATAGEGRDPQSVGEACCALMDAAALVGETQRIARWAPAAEGFRAAYDFGPLAGHLRPSSAGALSPFCGACCGGIYLVSGRLDEAESELIAAIQELEAAQMHSRCVHPVTQLAELRVLQGRLEEAESLLSRYEHLPECVRPLAALDLARGVPDVARRRLLARIEELEGLDVLALPLWMLLVDADLAAGDLNGAARAADAVARVASLTSSGAHAA